MGKGFSGVTYHCADAAPNPPDPASGSPRWWPPPRPAILATLRRLLDGGTPVDTRDERGRTALLAATARATGSTLRGC
jgi:hypothetical protein